MDPALLGMIVNLRPNVVGCGIDIARVIAETATKECEAIGVFTAATCSGDQKFLNVVVARKLGGRVADVLGARIFLKERKT